MEIPDAWWLVSLFLACALFSGGGWGRNIFGGWKTRLALEFLAHTLFSSSDLIVFWLWANYVTTR